MNPSGFVTEDNAAIDNGRCSPNRGARFRAPHEFALVRRDAIHVAIVRTDVDSILDHDRTCPKSVRLAAAAICVAIEFPNQFAGFFFEAKHVTVHGRGVNKIVDDPRSGSRLMAQRRLPDDRAVVCIQTKETARFRVRIDAPIDDRRTAFHRTVELSFEDDFSVGEVEAIIIMIFAPDVNSIADDRR